MADDGEDALIAAVLLDLSVDDEGVARQAEACPTLWAHCGTPYPPEPG
jgi:hypothetical protein